ncbi:hypothetical protein NDU88_010810 [Pleurodeles waltl]|uniref:Uncharacterized protein n=1 Tax=Pleurodeles waltl TaxID=8319 RepID=A0AAV7PVZ0_PLEWA|nr:hypothetical protein NDU88_010810 [Pleurodeles waltl]
MLLGGPEGSGATGWCQAALELQKLQRTTARVTLRGNRDRVSTGALGGSEVEAVEARRKAEVNKTMVRHQGGGSVECPPPEWRKESEL